MMNLIKIRSLLPVVIMAALVLSLIPSSGAQAGAMLSTEDFLNRLGVNTHLNGLTKDDPVDVSAWRFSYVPLLCATRSP